MKFSDNAMCAILLCSYIGINKDEDLKPFSLGEWNAFLERVIACGLEPRIVLGQTEEWRGKLSCTEEEAARIRALCTRGGSVAFELDDLNRKGIEVTTLFDPAYPPLLKRKLKRKTPPVLFYAGDLSLAGKVGVALVGSRDVDAAGMDFAGCLAEKAAREKLVVYSGGAKGVDTISAASAIGHGGAVVAFVADALISRIRKRDTVEQIMDGKLLLLSDMKPDAGFSAARAMNRNKFIYASAYGAFVVSSDYNKGGTWSGATEALRNEWTKVLVWDHKEYDGNQKLIEKGAVPYTLTEERLYDVITRKEETFEQIRMTFGQDGSDR